MAVAYNPLPNSAKERLKNSHPRGVELVKGIVRDLTAVNESNVGNDKRFTLVQKPNKYSIVYTPEIDPPIEVQVTFILGDDGDVLVTVFRVKEI